MVTDAQNLRRLLKSVVSAGKLFHILITLVLKKPRLTELTNLTNDEKVCDNL